MRKRIARPALIVSALVLAGFRANGQNATQSQPAPKAAQRTAQQAQSGKNEKLWTDDNIESLRSPEEMYLKDQEAAKEKLEAEQEAAKKLSALKGCSGGPTVKSIQQADEMIAQDKQDLKAQKDYVKQMEDQLANDPNADKERLEWRIESRSATAARIQEEITSLQKQRDALAKTTPNAEAESSSSPAPSTPQQ
ncbi:MAG TPA: hypothetical protein VMF66_15065 [Candidatus Acidoferrum sp.]|nr:hypothetical protein [Candidatus Acidoferrum sp.]